jgi:hypothetical protein
MIIKKKTEWLGEMELGGTDGLNGADVNGPEAIQEFGLEPRY